HLGFLPSSKVEAAFFLTSSGVSAASANSISRCSLPTKPGWPAYGSVLTTVDGQDVDSNGGYTDNGYQPNCTGTYGLEFQCVELVQRYFAVMWGDPSHWGVNYAYQMMETHPSDTIAIPNGSSPGPQRGDALVFSGETTGHVAIVTGVSGGQITFAEQ